MTTIRCHHRVELQPFHQVHSHNSSSAALRSTDRQVASFTSGNHTNGCPVSLSASPRISVTLRPKTPVALSPKSSVTIRRIRSRWRRRYVSAPTSIALDDEPMLVRGIDGEVAIPTIRLGLYARGARTPGLGCSARRIGINGSLYTSG